MLDRTEEQVLYMRGGVFVRHVCLLFLLSSVILASLASPVAAQEKQYRDPGGGFSLAYPGDLTVVDNDIKNCLTLFSKERGFALAVSYADAAGLPGNNIQQLCRQYPFVELMCIEKIKESGFEVQSKNEVNFKGIPALQYGLETAKNNTAFSGDSLMFINGGRMYFILFHGIKKDYAKNTSLFNSIMATLKI